MVNCDVMTDDHRQLQDSPMDINIQFGRDLPHRQLPNYVVPGRQQTTTQKGTDKMDTPYRYLEKKEWLYEHNNQQHVLRLV